MLIYKTKVDLEMLKCVTFFYQETAVMHGFITAEDFNKPKPPPKPRKPRPLKDKRKLKVGMSEELMPANINMPITVAVQLRDDRVRTLDTL